MIVVKLHHVQGLFAGEVLFDEAAEALAARLRVEMGGVDLPTRGK